jgi:hypothetical protein
MTRPITHPITRPITHQMTRLTLCEQTGRS